jgi:ketosteroid isomerase-like protein
MAPRRSRLAAPRAARDQRSDFDVASLSVGFTPKGEEGEMSNLDLVKEITDAFCSNHLDREVLSKYFDRDFKHIANGAETDLAGYSAHLAEYGSAYKHFRIPAWEELFESGDKVVTSYMLEGDTASGEKQNTAVMAIWRIKDGKVTSLREVDAADAS